MRISEVAKATGLTIRTLRWYEQKGLLNPGRTDSGHRIYNTKVLEQLQLIVSLKSLGMELSEIKNIIDSPDTVLVSVIDSHKASIKNQLDIYRSLYEKLNILSDKLRSDDEMTKDDFLKTIKVTYMFEKYYSKEQLETLKQKAQSIGKEEMTRVQGRWPELIVEIKGCMNKNLPVDDSRVTELAREWKALVELFSGGSQGIEKNLNTAYQANPDFAKQTGLDSNLFNYIGEALKLV